MLRFLRIALAVTLVVAGMPSAFAQDPHSPSASAESQYQTAVRLFGEGRYVEALEAFDRAIEISPESIFYCNRAVVLIKLGEPLEALESLETCQKTFAGGRAELAGIDAQRLGVSAMVHHVRSGALDTVSAMNAPTLEPRPETGGWSRASTGYVFLGVGGALLASAVTLDRLSVDLKTDFVDEAAGQVGSTEADYEAARDAYVRRQRAWLGLTVGGAAVTLLGSVLVASHFLVRGRDVEIGVMTDRPGVTVRLYW